MVAMPKKSMAISFMSEISKIIIGSFGLAFVWIYFIHIAMIFIISRRDRPRHVYQLIGFLFTCLLAVGLFPIISGFSAVQTINDLTRSQRLFFGILYLNVGIILPMILSSCTVMAAFPEKWKRFRSARGRGNSIMQGQMKTNDVTPNVSFGKSCKEMSPSRWRLLALCVFVNFLALMFAIKLIWTLPAEDHKGVFWLSVMFPISLLGIGVVLILFRKYPPKDQ